MLASMVFPPTSAGDLIVSWDPSTDATGYRIHYGPNPSQYDYSFDVGNATQTNLNSLGDCMMWHFAATAYNVAGESGYSEEVASWPRPVLAQASPNAAEQGRQLDVSLSGTNFQGGATVSFSDPAITVNSVTVSSCTELSVNVTIGNAAGVGPVIVTVAHPNGVSGESPVLSVEAAVAPIVTATTPTDGAVDVAVDVRPTVQFSEPVTTATISAATVRLLDAAGNPVAQASGSPSLSPDGTVATLTPAGDLDQGGTYRVEVLGGSAGVLDLAGHPMDATYAQSAGFQTVSDTSAPVISDVVAFAVGSTTATIGWTTDEASSSQVLYRKLGQTDYQQTAVDESLVTAHSVLLQGLAPNTSYEFEVRSADAAGNNAMDSSGQTFSTTDNAYSYVVFEAESGTLSAPLQVVAGADAFGGAWIEMASGSGSPNNPNGIATFGVHLPAAGEWFLWVRVYAPSPASDSWVASVDGGSWSTLSAPATGEWLWVAGTSYGLADGLHALDLGGQDSGARADRILLTDDPNFVPTEQPGSDLTPPAPVAQFDATPFDGSNVLDWTNPSDPGFARTVIRYRTDGVYPQSAVDGFPVLDSAGSPGSVETHTHQGLTNGVTYFYSAFAVDAVGNEAPAAQIEATPEATLSPPPPPNNVNVF